jgi:hypothetical protein
MLCGPPQPAARWSSGLDNAIQTKHILSAGSVMHHGVIKCLCLGLKCTVHIISTYIHPVQENLYLLGKRQYIHQKQKSQTNNKTVI